jgi:hypothetical protein
MKNEIAIKMSPEGLEVANTYLQLGSITDVCDRLSLDENTVSEYLNKREIKQYIDQVYLDTGYRNRFKLADTLDNIIDEKLNEAEERPSGFITDGAQNAHGRNKGDGRTREG